MTPIDEDQRGWRAFSRARRRDLRRARQAAEVSPGYLRNNAPRLLSYAVYALLNLALFAWAAHRYQGQGPLVQIARGCGACMNFNGAFCLLPMMRLLISLLRRTAAARYLALEESVGFHQLAGHVMFACAAVHTAAYLVLYRFVRPGGLTANLMGSRAAITGWVLAILFCILWLFAVEALRRRVPFELFYATHFLGVAIVALLLWHSPRYWKWFLVGGTGYLLDRLVRFYRMRSPTTLLSARPLPSRVTELVIARPAGFDYRAGDFVFVLIPRLSRLEWHPFTISSAPERPGSFTLHVRTLGDWTERLHQAAPSLQGPLPVYVDGPHGAPANDIFSAKVAVLIAAGIGVTPFASILQSLLCRHRSGGAAAGLPRRVHFYWINRDQRAFEWFTAMLEELARADGDGLFDLRLFVTEPPPGPLPPLTQAGRPDWDGELRRVLAGSGADDVSVFYCGPRGLGEAIHERCRRLGLRYKEEHF